MINQPSKVKQISYMKDFQCLADKCSDTCCVLWVVDVTDENKRLYDQEAPDINKTVEKRAGSGYRMKEKGTDCIWFGEDRFCNLQRQYGEKFLPDICRSFPRSHKKFGNETYMVANLACPESIRLALYSNDKSAFSSWDKIEQNYTKSNLRDLKSHDFQDNDNEQLMSIYHYIVAKVDDADFSADQILARLLLVSNHLDKNEHSSWSLIIHKLFNLSGKDKIIKIAQDDVNNVDSQETMDAMLKIIFVLLNRDRPRYNKILAVLKKHLGDRFDDKRKLQNNYQRLKDKWQKEQQQKFEPILKNLIKVIISYNMFPIACYFNKKHYSMVSIILEYMAVKLFLMCRNEELNGDFNVTEVIDTIQPVTKRFYIKKSQKMYSNYIYDHCKDCGWDDYNKVISVLLNF